MESKKYISHNKEVIFTELEGDEGVLLSLESKIYYSLNETGMVAWKLLNGKRTIGDILDILAEEFSATIERINKPILGFIKALESEKLIIFSEAAK